MRGTLIALALLLSFSAFASPDCDRNLETWSQRLELVHHQVEDLRRAISTRMELSRSLPEVWSGSAISQWSTILERLAALNRSLSNLPLEEPAFTELIPLENEFKALSENFASTSQVKDDSCGWYGIRGQRCREVERHWPGDLDDFGF